MAKTKDELIKRGKELGLNLKKTMSNYELEHRIKEAEEAQKSPKSEEKKSPKKARGGEY